MNSRCTSVCVLWFGLAWLPGFLGGCAILEKQQQGSQAESQRSVSSARSSSAAFDQQELKELSETQHNKVLSEGYSQLYDSASGLAYLDEFLVLKFESKATDAVITDIAEYAATLKGQLEQLAKDYPSLSLDDDGLPVLEKRTRSAVQQDRIVSLAPLVGRTGANFERTLLLTQSGALNQLRFLTQITAEAEKSAERRAFLNEAKQTFARLYGEVVQLLNEQYFCPADR